MSHWSLYSPGSSGAVTDHSDLVGRLHADGVLVAVATDLLALALLVPPGEWGADIAVGSAQRFGVPLGYGGPHAGFMATRENMVRALPGRLVGVSSDRLGNTAYRLALQTREQHIRRERATSNVCTAQVLLAVIAGFYASWHGPDGIWGIASEVHGLTSRLARTLTSGGVKVVNETWFDTLTVRPVGGADAAIHAAFEAGVNLGRVDDDHIRIALDETTTPDILARVLGALGLDELATGADTAIPPGLARRSEFLTHPVFNTYQSEHEMLRYLRRLADRDLALDRSMIPLGSCTMKLNATTEMIPVTWPGFAGIHPYAPGSQATGYLEMIRELGGYLCAATGYDVISFQPNAGSQGELAGLLAIRAYHESRGEGHRDVCLIPASAHGTNAASAVMAGMTLLEQQETGSGKLTALLALADALDTEANQLAES